MRDENDELGRGERRRRPTRTSSHVRQLALVERRATRPAACARSSSTIPSDPGWIERRPVSASASRSVRRQAVAVGGKPVATELVAHERVRREHAEARSRRGSACTDERRSRRRRATAAHRPAGPPGERLALEPEQAPDLAPGRHARARTRRRGARARPRTGARPASCGAGARPAPAGEPGGAATSVWTASGSSAGLSSGPARARGLLVRPRVRLPPPRKHTTARLARASS